MAHPRLEITLYGAFAALLAVLLTASFLPGSNEAAFRFINAWGAGSESFWAGLTLLGDTLLTVTLLLPFIWRRPQVVWMAFLAGLVATLMVHGLKPFFGWPRPLAVLPVDSVHVIGHALRSNSFPSGHSATIATVIGALALALRAPWWGVLLAIGTVMLVGLSRSVVGAHWPQDVAAGVLIGWVSAWIGMRLASRWPVNRRWGQPLLALLLVACMAQLFTFDGGYPEGRWVVWPVLAWAILGSAWVLWRANRRTA